VKKVLSCRGKKGATASIAKVLTVWLYRTIKEKFFIRKLSKSYTNSLINAMKNKKQIQDIEKDISQFSPVSDQKKEFIEGIIDKANAKKSISLRLKANDLELLKHRADSEGLPYQTLLSSIVHKFVSDQLVDKRSILKSLEILKSS
jgi:predicted DNA binding CopG/RHH family protein